MSVMQEIGPQLALSQREIETLARKVSFEAQIARQCASAGRAEDHGRALEILRRINALTAGIARREQEEGQPFDRLGASGVEQ